MKEVQKIVYVSFDGKDWPTKTACRDHEHANLHLALAALKPEQIVAAIKREDAELADLIEAAGDQCRTARLKAGGHRRRTAETNGAQPQGEPANDDAETQQEPTS